MSKTAVRVFSPEIKLKTLERLAAGEPVSSLARSLGVHRQLIYKWRDAQRAGTLGKRRGPPTRAEALAKAQAGGLSELEQARRRIAELERKVGQQAVELDFFQGALRRIKASRLLSE